jgi:hypothetical protein
VFAVSAGLERAAAIVTHRDRYDSQPPYQRPFRDSAVADTVVRNDAVGLRAVELCCCA